MSIYAFLVPSKVVLPESYKSTNTCDYEWCHRKVQPTYLLFRESRNISFLSVGKCFPCVVASLMFERRFCSGGLCFLTSGSGIFRCWLWIISCNDGSAWHVCLDSMPSSWNTDQTDLSYWLRIGAGVSLNRLKSFILTCQKEKGSSVVNIGKISEQDQGTALSLRPIIC